MVDFTISFCSCWKEWICISCKNITLREKSPNLLNIAHLTPDCLFYELKIICRDFSVCCYDNFHPFSFLARFDDRPLVSAHPSTVTVYKQTYMWKEKELKEFFFLLSKKRALQWGLYFILYPHLFSSTLYASFNREMKCLSGFFITMRSVFLIQMSEFSGNINKKPSAGPLLLILILTRYKNKHDNFMVLFLA